MPPLPSVAGVVRIDFEQSINEDTRVFNRLFFTYTGGVASVAFCEAVANNASGGWGGNMASVFAVDQSLTGVNVTDLSSPSGNTGFNGTVYAGTDAGVTIPAGSAFRLKFLLPRRYRGGKPGLYLSGLTQDRMQDAQTWTAATVTEIVGQYILLGEDIVGTSAGGQAIGHQCNVSYYEGFTSVENPVTHRWRNIPTLRPVPVVDPIIGVQGDTHISSQRRRNQIRS